MKPFVALAAAAVLALALPVLAHGDTVSAAFAPRDECRAIPGAASFLDALASAVKTRDSGALLALAADDVKLDFGGGEGKDELRARLEGKVAGYGDLWHELSAVLPLGCAYDGSARTMTLPWYFAQDFGERDAFSTMLVIDPAAKLRARPEVDAKALRTLGWDAVEVPGSYDPEVKFTEVVLSDGTRGFVRTAALRSLIDYRLIAERKNDGWKIVAFIAGD